MKKSIHGKRLTNSETRARMNEMGLFPDFSLKFRYFDPEMKIFCYSTDFKFKNPFERLQCFFAKARNFAKSVDQWIGLQDKDGVDIYTNDIVSVPLEHGQARLLSVKFGVGRRQVTSFVDNYFDVDIPSFHFCDLEEQVPIPLFPIVENWQGKHDLDIMEVMGNMYQWEGKI